MKRHRIWTLYAAVALLQVACNPYSENAIKGVLYADSTLTSPLPGKTLVFHEGEDVYYDYSFPRYLGYATTDMQGRWAFQYVRHLDNPYQGQPPTGAKLQLIEYTLLITCDGDTLYTGSAQNTTAQGVALYPGCWENPNRRFRQTDMADTTAGNRKGGLQ